MFETSPGRAGTYVSGSQQHLFLIRHGRTTLNADGKLRGHLDPPLDDVGTAEAMALASTLAVTLASTPTSNSNLADTRPMRIVTSPLARARQTAEAIGRRNGSDPIVEKRLIDRDYGQWAGRRPDEVIAQWGTLDSAPGVEPAADVAERARAVLDEQIDWLRLGPVVLVAHDAVNRLLLRSLDPDLGAVDAIGQRTGCWNLLLHNDDGWQIQLIDQPSR